MSDWQPIETAPKDGTRVLVYWRFSTGTGGCGVDNIRLARWVDGFENPANAPIRHGAWTDYSVADWNDETFSEFHPTHWMPLPSSPSGET